MNSFENKKHLLPHLKVPEDASESQTLISLGEEALARAHQISHGIEERVQRLLNEASVIFCPQTSDQRDQLLSNPHAGEEQSEVQDAVDNWKRRW